MNTSKPSLSKFNKHYKQGRYIPKYPEKYVGDTSNIIYRSGLELFCFKYLDLNNNVLKWGSENIVINYYDTSTSKQRKYYVDLYAEYKNKDGNSQKIIIEVKPKSQTIAPKNGRNYDKRVLEYHKNLSKWKTARAYAESRGWSFIILTEENLKRG